ncbi:shikimate dehydrogenase [Thioflexithrix psekupsensis]|uniref:Shikimate dehydrogenase (NADP(+)) n=1 Tax=Thioflexithrix psekupsensis TaxID=1570016 RepID=A0A251XAP4_9GAMM|nr:shikimate dehydrogenase [Thioflexithrix psekupsensis]OUD14592.1 shikimate dehydrogenase [Thioflexithrix psekupsensis]
MTLIPDRYVVMGNPIAHSKSPHIHTLFAQQTQQIMTYEAHWVAERGLFQAIKHFQEEGGRGLNITLPFKTDAWQLAQQRSSRAENAGAVNTLWFDSQGQWVGDNTDGVGLLRDITVNYQRTLADKSLLILGAGGAVRGVLGILLAQQLGRCVIANRTVEKAQLLADLFKNYGTVEAMRYEDLTGQKFDLIINGTSASLQGELPPLPPHLFSANGWAYDMMYGALPTAFMQWALQQGAARALDGLGMLVEQAAESFYLWRGVRPQTEPVMIQLRQEMRAKITQQALELAPEFGGPVGLNPVRYGDWEKAGRCIDF